MNAQVVTCISGIPDKPYYYWNAFYESLRRYAEPPAVLGWGFPGAWSGGRDKWCGLMTKPLMYRDWIRAGMAKSDRLILSDSYDVVFQKHPHDVGDRCKEYYGDAVVFNCEKGLFPREDLRPQFDALPANSEFKYLNSGFICGPTEAILTLLEAMPLDEIGQDRRREDGSWYHPNDQGEFQQAFFDHADKVKMVLDTGCLISQTFSSCDASEFDFTGEYVRNNATGTEPGFLHCNGGAKNDIYPLFVEKWGLPI